MTTDNALAVRHGGDLGDFVPPPESLQPPATNPLVLVHSLLRGRYRLAITLVITGLVIGAPLGYLAQQPKYKSVGTIRVQPNLQKILYQTEQNGMMPMFDLFVAEQIGQIKSPRITDEAILHPEWKAFGRGLRPEQTADFKENLEVLSSKGSPYIQISFTDRDPKAAAAAVKAVIETYMRVYSDTEGESGLPALSVLEKRRFDLSTSLNNINERIQAIANDYGSASLQEVYDFKLAELNHVESQVRAAEIQVVLSGGQPSAPVAPGIVGVTPTTTPSALAGATPMPAAAETDDVLAFSDPLLRNLYQEKRVAEREIAVLERRYGSHHPKVDDLRTSLSATVHDISERLEQLHHDGPRLAAAGMQPANNGMVQSREQFAANLNALKKLYNDLKSETVALGRKNLEIEKLRADSVEFRERLAETKTRIEQLNLEKNVGGRINVMNYGDVPIVPEKDKRLALAGAGGAGLAGLGVAFVLLLGFLDGRMQHIDAARKQLKRVDRLLGVLPQLPPDLNEAEQASAAAHCVHQVRAMLQIRQRITGDKSYAITSPSPGEGKTSLTIALGMSLASSGCRTLLVDCDLDGAGLSARMGRSTRRLLGQILLDLGLIGESKLQEGLNLAKAANIRLGEALGKLRIIDERTIDDAIRIQRKAAPGLGEVLAGTEPEQAIHSTGFPSLSILPLGSPGGAHAGRLSPDAFKRLMDKISDKFDIILADCGPILGSVEAAIVAAGIDGVILVISRGGDRSAADSAVNLLISAGAQIEGVVFNRAQPEDVADSVYGSSASAHVSRGVSRNDATGERNATETRSS